MTEQQVIVVPTPSPDARTAIDESAATGQPVTLEYLRDQIELDESVASLERLAEGSAVEGDTQEFWGVSEAGPWRVRVRTLEHG